MQIIKEGETPKQPNPWWVGVRITCRNCKTEVMLEEGDPVTVIAIRSLYATRYIEFTCPVCKNTLRESNKDAMWDNVYKK